jgi:hypothetical protein
MENKEIIKKCEEENREKLRVIINELMAHDPDSTWNKIQIDNKKVSSAILKVKLSLEKIVFLELCQDGELEFFQNQYNKTEELYKKTKELYVIK